LKKSKLWEPKFKLTMS